MERIGKDDVQGIDSFQAYVRRAIVNRINDQIRSARRRQGTGDLPEDVPDGSPSPIEQAIGADVLDRFERGIAALSEEDRHLVHLRIELDFGYSEIATITGRNTPDAARMAVQRALRKLVDIMGTEP
jgi:RNA polymerase sigma-70 factor (ECF subfamily)